MLFLFYPFAAVVSLFFLLTALFGMNIICALWVIVTKNGKLPKYLYYYQTFDALVPTDSFISAVKWLYRNPSYGFDYYLLGIKWFALDWKVYEYYSTDLEDLFFAYSTNGAFNFYYIGPCGEYKFGWKSFNMYVPKTDNFQGYWGNAGNIPLAFTINPFKTKQN